ncbi:MAG: CaiB/BaiF CoA transferase family protein [Dehalococcoidia bacterium]
MSAANRVRSPRLPLHNIRVVDFSRVWAGPFGARFLADFGADVIRVESARFPDMRATPGLPPRVRRERDAHFAEMHRNKRSVTLDLHGPRGRELARRLVAEADVVVENFGPGVMDRWGLGYADLRAVKPDLIMVGMPGLGGEGPHSTYLAYGQQLMGYLGLSPLWRQPESPMAASCKLAYPDFIAAGQLAVGVTAALLHREQTGEGQYIEVAQIDSVASMMGVAFLDYFLNGRIWEPQGNAGLNHAPHSVYRCLGHDRWVAIACETEEEWRALCAAMDAPDLAADPRFATRALRHEHRAALDPLIAAWTEGQTPHQVMERLQRAGVPAGVVATSEDLYHDVHLRGRGFLVTIDHPQPGRLDHPGMTARLSATPGCVRRPAPLLGEHNEEVFLDLLRLPQAEYEELIDEGVIG